MPRKQAVKKMNDAVTIQRQIVFMTPTQSKQANLSRVLQNFLSSPLLALPDLVRDKILGYAMGGGMIHVGWLGLAKSTPLRQAEGKVYDASLEAEGVFRHSICVAGVSESEAFNQFRNGLAVVPVDDSAEYYVETCQSRHERCRCWLLPSFTNHHDFWRREQAKPATTLNLELLGACRQIYAEANKLLWLCNTFSFSDGESYLRFMAKLNPSSKQQVAHLHLNIIWDNFRYISGNLTKDWTRHLKVAHIQMLRGLQTLNICFNITKRRQAIIVDNDIATAEACAGWFDGIMRFRMLDLRQLTVIVSDDVQLLQQLNPRAFAANIQDVRFTAAEKRGMANQITGRLTDPQGASNFQAEEATRHAANKALYDNRAVQGREAS